MHWNYKSLSFVALTTPRPSKMGGEVMTKEESPSKAKLSKGTDDNA